MILILTAMAITTMSVSYVGMWSFLCLYEPNFK